MRNGFARLVAWTCRRNGYIAVALGFLVLNAVGYRYAGGLAFVQGWGGGFAAVIATWYLVVKSQGYWIWMVVNAALWTALFFNMGLPMLAYLQISFLLMCTYGAIQWSLVKYDIGFRLDRRSDVVGAVIAVGVFAYSVVAYISLQGYAWTGWWWVEFGSVATAIGAIWMDAYRYRVNWILWTVSNCFSAPLFLHGRLWGPLLTIPIYQAINVWGWFVWSREQRGQRDTKAFLATNLKEPTPLTREEVDRYLEDDRNVVATRQQGAAGA